MRTELYLALNYLKFSKKDKNISIMMRVCFLGIFIGTFALMLTLTITNGFEKTIHEKIQGINSQITLNYPGHKLATDDIRGSLLKEFPEIKALSGSSVKQLLLDRNGKQSLIIVKGIEPEHESQVSSLNSKLLLPQSSLRTNFPPQSSLRTNFPTKSLLRTDDSSQSSRSSSIPLPSTLKETLSSGGLLIGHKLASEWNLNVGDEVKVLIPDNASSSKIYLSKKRVKIAGIFNIGLDEYDSGFAFSTLKFINDTFDEEGADQISIKLDSPQSFFRKKFSNHEETFIKKLKKRLPAFSIYSWRDLYPALVSSLKLEKYAMFLIIALITLVASLNMISLLFIQVQNKKRDIAILKAMGMVPKNISNIFLIMGMSLTLLGSLFGLFFAAIVGWILETYPLIKLPDVYYVSHLPARVEPELFFIVFLCTVLLGFIATYLPAKRASKINVSDVLRME